MLDFCCLGYNTTALKTHTFIIGRSEEIMETCRTQQNGGKFVSSDPSMENEPMLDVFIYPRLASVTA